MNAHSIPVQDSSADLKLSAVSLHKCTQNVNGYIYMYIYIYTLEISPASRDIISSVIHVGVLGVVGCAWHCGMCLALLEIFSVHIHKVYAQIKSFGWGGGGT